MIRKTAGTAWWSRQAEPARKAAGCVAPRRRRKMRGCRDSSAYFENNGEETLDRRRTPQHCLEVARGAITALCRYRAWRAQRFLRLLRMDGDTPNTGVPDDARSSDSEGDVGI